MPPPPLRLSIRRHQFNVSCAAQDEESMRRAAQMIEDKIRELRGKTGVADDERAALMAALQIAFESQLAPETKTESAKAAKKQDSHLAAKNDSAAPDFTDILRRIDGALARTESSLQGRAPMA